MVWKFCYREVVTFDPNVMVLACVRDFHSSAEGSGHPVYPER